MSTGIIGEQNQTVSLPKIGADETGPAKDYDTGAQTVVISDALEAGDTDTTEPLLIPAETIPAAKAAAPRSSRFRRVARETSIYAAFAALAFWVTHQYWLSGHVTATDISDQAFFETMLAHGAWAMTHFSNPMFMTQLNAPLGVNMMANTSVLAYSLPLTPITLWFGPAVSFAFLMTFGLAATAAAWYHVLSRHIVKSRSAAIIGGLIAGFGPGIVSHANGHPNIIAQFLLPFIAWRTIRLREEGRSVRNGVALAGLVILQFFLNEEMLFLGALTLGLIFVGYAIARRRTVRPEIAPFLKGLGVALGITMVVLAYPLWYQFFGPVSYRGLDEGVKTFSTDLYAFPAFATRTIFGSLHVNRHLSRSVAEENSFFGWPLLLAFGVTVYWLRRNLIARILAVVAVILSVLSLGQTIIIHGHHTKVPGPWRLLIDLPLFDSAVPTRVTLLVLPIVAVMIALGHDRAMGLLRSGDARASGRPRARAWQAIAVWCSLLGIALVGIAPTPITTQQVAPTPAFFATGEWRQYVSPTQTVLPVPLPGPGVVDAMFWQAQAQLAFNMPRGYFLGPDPSKHDVAMFGASDRPTAVLLGDVETTDTPAVVHKSDRAAALADLRYWKVAVIVEVPSDPSELAVRESISDLIGIKPKFVGGVWLWDVRGLVSGASSVNLE